MIFLNQDESNLFSDACLDNYGQAGAVFIKISTEDTDISDDLNSLYYKGHEYPDWTKLPLCLRSDWKRFKLWEIAEGAQLANALQTEISRRFRRPDILSEVADTLVGYAGHLFGKDLCRTLVQNKLNNLYCLGKDETDTIFTAHFLKDEGYKKEGYQKLFDAILLGRLGGLIEDVVWNHNNI